MIGGVDLIGAVKQVVSDGLAAAKNYVNEHRTGTAATLVAIPTAIFATVIGAREVISYKATGSVTPKLKDRIKLMQKGFQAIKDIKPATRNGVLASVALATILVALVALKKHYSKEGQEGQDDKVLWKGTVEEE